MNLYPDSLHFLLLQSASTSKSTYLTLSWGILSPSSLWKPSLVAHVFDWLPRLRLTGLFDMIMAVPAAVRESAEVYNTPMPVQCSSSRLCKTNSVSLGIDPDQRKRLWSPMPSPEDSSRGFVYVRSTGHHRVHCGGGPAATCSAADPPSSARAMVDEYPRGGRDDVRPWVSALTDILNMGFA